MEYKILVTEIASAPTYILSASTDKRKALILHGYGSNKEEMLGCALSVVKVGFKVYVCDLPGHGEHKDKLNWKSVKEFIQNLKNLEFEIVIGHSLGARLACLFFCPKLILISPPFEAKFKGSKKELVKILRARRVKEEKYYQGLIEVLNSLPEFSFDKAQKVLLLYSNNDLDTVKTAVQKAKELEAQIEIIPGVNHNDIISHHLTFKKIFNWIKD